MDRAELYRRWYSAQAGIVKAEDLRLVREDAAWWYYRCPCGGTDHVAMRRKPELVVTCDGYSWTEAGAVACCFPGRATYLIDDDVARIIREEEERFDVLIARHEADGVLGKRVSAAEAYRLYTEQGCPPDLLDIEDSAAFDALVARHKATSRRKSG